MSSGELERRSIAILLVEDNEDDASLLERHLRKSGLDPAITRVEVAEEMQAALATSRPDVVIADYNLPKFSGPEALVLTRASGLDLPFIMMSGAISEETAVESMRAGAQDYVTKQNLARLIPVLERELREAATRRSRALAERALEASETRFHKLVDAMPLGLLMSDAAGRITYANDSAGQILALSDESIDRGEVSLSSMCSVLRVPFAEQRDPFEATFERTDGTMIEALIGVAFLDRDGAESEREIAVFLADLTKQKRGEEVLRRTEKLAVAGRLAASIAHEINNPLAAITNCLYLVEQTELSEQGRAYLDIAQKELDRVAQITVQTLRFHRQSSKPVATDLRELIDTVLALFESRIRRQQIAVERRYRQSVSIFMYEGEIRQVIVNLLGNAIDAMPLGGAVFIRVANSRDWTTGTVGLALTIADRGSGMSEDTLRRLFEPFYSTKGVTGTGLGLWVSKEIVDRHRGTVHVRSRKSAEGRAGGTTFRIFLPLDGLPVDAPASSLPDLHAPERFN